MFCFDFLLLIFSFCLLLLSSSPCLPLCQHRRVIQSVVFHLHACRGAASHVGIGWSLIVAAQSAQVSMCMRAELPAFVKEGAQSEYDSVEVGVQSEHESASEKLCHHLESQSLCCECRHCCCQVGDVGFKLCSALVGHCSLLYWQAAVATLRRVFPCRQLRGRWYIAGKSLAGSSLHCDCSAQQLDMNDVQVIAWFSQIQIPSKKPLTSTPGSPWVSLFHRFASQFAPELDSRLETVSEWC